MPTHAGSLKQTFLQQMSGAVSIVVSIPAFQAGRPGSIPGRRTTFQTLVTSEIPIDMKTTPVGFEPTRAEPNGFLVHLLNHSDTVSAHRSALRGALFSNWRHEEATLLNAH